MVLPRLKDVPRRSDRQVMCDAAFIAFRVRKESKIDIYWQVHTGGYLMVIIHNQSRITFIHACGVKGTLDGFNRA